MIKYIQNSQQLPDLLPIPLIFLDHELRIQSWNLAAKNMLNLDAKKHAEQHIGKLSEIRGVSVKDI